METAFNCFWFWIVDFYISNLCQKSQNQHILTFFWRENQPLRRMVCSQPFSPLSQKATGVPSIETGYCEINKELYCYTKHSNLQSCKETTILNVRYLVNGDDIYHPKNSLTTRGRPCWFERTKWLTLLFSKYKTFICWAKLVFDSVDFINILSKVHSYV